MTLTSPYNNTKLKRKEIIDYYDLWKSPLYVYIYLNKSLCGKFKKRVKLTQQTE